MIFYILITLVLFLISIILVETIRYPSFKKIILVGLYVVMVVTMPIAYFDTLSKPKEFNDERLNIKEVNILYYQVEYGKALYFLFAAPEFSEPRYYVMPWSEKAKELAQKIQDAQNELKMRGDRRKLKILKPFERSLEKEMKLITPPPELVGTPKDNPPPRNNLIINQHRLDSSRPGWEGIRPY